MMPQIGIPEVVFILVVGIVVGIGHVLLPRLKGKSPLKILFSVAVACAVFGAVSMVGILAAVDPLEGHDDHGLVDFELMAFASFYAVILATPIACITYGLARKIKK